MTQVTAQNPRPGNGSARPGQVKGQAEGEHLEKLLSRALHGAREDRGAGFTVCWQQLTSCSGNRTRPVCLFSQLSEVPRHTRGLNRMQCSAGYLRATNRTSGSKRPINFNPIKDMVAERECWRRLRSNKARQTAAESSGASI